MGSSDRNGWEWWHHGTDMRTIIWKKTRCVEPYPLSETPPAHVPRELQVPLNGAIICSDEFRVVDEGLQVSDPTGFLGLDVFSRLIKSI